jgi:thiol:disulfide interchange protein DsbA
MIRSLLATLAMLSIAPVWAQGIAFQEGVHYTTIQPPQPTNDASRVEVIEVFGYTCPHCANFQPFIEPWAERAGENVNYYRMPVVFQRSWEPFARAYYVAEAMGILDQSHLALFDALHKERQRLRTDEDMADFFAQFGVSEEDYLNTAKSFAVETKLRRTVTLTQRYGITGTPTVVVNGKYLAMARMAGGHNELIQLIDFLIAKESAEVAASEPAAAGESSD